jgi:hypothetical protein
MCMISALDLRGLLSLRTPVEHHTHPTSATTDLGDEQLVAAVQIRSYTPYRHEQRHTFKNKLTYGNANISRNSVHRFLSDYRFV